MKMRKKSGLLWAHRMYQGSAVRQKAATAPGRRRRKASRQRSVKRAQKKTAPPQRIIPAGPLARTPRPRKTPKRTEVRDVDEVKDEERPTGLGATIPMIIAAKTIAMVSMAEKGISVAAA